MTKKTHSQTIFSKILFPLVVVIILQACLLCGILFWGGPLVKLEENAFDSFNNSSQSRASILEADMIQRWSNLDELQQLTASHAAAVTSKAGISYQELGEDTNASSSFLSAASSDLIYTLRKNGVTEAYIILNGYDPTHAGSGSFEKNGLYIRDYNPESTNANNSDLFIERGPSSVCQKLALPLDAYWEPKITIQEQDTFYYNPLEAYESNPKLGTKNSAYWNGPVKITQDDIKILTYTQPLVDPSGEIYGILGVSISLDYLYQQMPYQELSNGNTASYVLAKQVPAEDGRIKYDTITSSGSTYKYLLGNQSDLTFQPYDEFENTYILTNSTKTQDTIYGNITNFQLYNTNTPFSSQSLALISISTKNDLLYFSLWLKKTCFLMILISLGIGVFAAFLIGYRITKPITNLSRKVQNANPRKPVVLDKLGIREIDRLGGSIENLSASVAAYSSKVSHILDMASVPVAAFEYESENTDVFCSKNFFNMIGKGGTQREDFSISKNEFLSAMKDLEQHFQNFSEKSQTGNYKLRDENGTVHWYRLYITRSGETTTGVITDITLEIAEKHRLEYERDYDILTNLLNRRAFLAQASAVFANPSSIKHAALVMIDLDNLKYINDTYGHEWGDEYLKCASGILKELRDKNAIVSRMSGDEFNILFHGYKERTDLEEVMMEMRQALSGAYILTPDGKTFRLRASAGIAWYPEDSMILDTLLKYADFAMYQVKHSDKGNIRNFDIASYKKEAYLLMGKEDLHQLIDNELVDYAYQPIVSARDGSVMGYEALMRPKSKTLSNPADVISLAKSQSMLQKIESLTLRKATGIYFNERIKDPFHCPALFINSLPNQILTAEEMKAFTAAYGPYLNNIVVEITEIAQVDSSSLELKKQMVSKYNMKIALDDYGTGHNSEHVLLNLMPDYVKIDNELVHNIDQDTNRLEFLENMIIYFKSKNIKVIAEGVETVEEMKVLVQCGVDYMQGYFFGKPEHNPQLPYAGSLESLIQAVNDKNDNYKH